MNPYAVFRPESYNNTYVSGTFPQHNWPFEHTRQIIGNRMHDVFNPYVGQHAITPRADVRETMKRYYIDVELPGLKSKDSVSLTWTNGSTLLLEAEIHRPAIEFDEDEKKAEPGVKKDEKGETSDGLVHLLLKERHIGKCARSFTFFVSVNSETMTAKLMNGVLYIILEKMPHEQIKPKKVNVEEAES